MRRATIKSRALGALKLASEASCARSARWECAREAGRFFLFNLSRGSVKLLLYNNYLIIIISKALFTVYLKLSSL